MSNQVDIERVATDDSLHRSDPSTSSDIVPPSFNTVVRPQLNLHEEDEPNSTNSSYHLRLLKTPVQKARKGFNLSDFKDSGHENSLSASYDDPHSADQQNETTEPVGLRERLYLIVDSSITTAILFVVLVFDYVLLMLRILLVLVGERRQYPALEGFHRALDWITAIAFLIETNTRLHCYGPAFYFRSVLRCCEYLISTTNTIFVVASRLSSARWLGIARFFRLLRLITLVVDWRERKLKWRTRQELESLAILLEKEKSDRSRLTKWRIESDDIAIGERAGHGGFGTVFSGLFRGTLVAVKQLPLFEGDQTSISIEDEAITLVNLRHPNVVLFMGFVHEPSKLWIVTEYCSRGSLRDLLDDDDFPLTESRALKLALGAARGLAYLHGQDPPMLHLDLKTSNILISSGWDAKLGDFGLSRSIDNIDNCFSGTVQYAAPEILEANLFSTAADIYSFGVCLWEIAAREVPFRGESPMSVLWGVVKSKLRPSICEIRVKEEDSECKGLEIQIEADDRTATTPKARARNALDYNKASEAYECKVYRSDSHKDASRTRRQAAGYFPSTENERMKDSGTSRYTEDEHGTAEKKSASVHVVKDTKIGINDSSKATTPTEGTGNFAPGQIISTDPEQEQDMNEISSRYTAGLNDGQHSAPSTFQRPGKLLQKNAQTHDRSDVGGQLDDLTRRVTATIHKFDDRPPVLRRKDGDEPGRSQLEGSVGENDASSSGLQPKISSLIRNTFSRRNSLRTSSTASKRIPVKASGSESFQSPSGTEESEAFARRMANFSVHGSSPIIASRKREREGGRLGPSQTQEQIFSTKQPSKQPPVQVPKEYVDLIQKCWAQDPNHRPSASQIVWRLVLLIGGQMRDKSSSEH